MGRVTARGAMRGMFAVLTSVFCLAAVLLMVLAIFGKTDGVGVTRVAERPVLRVLSDSMAPMFTAGDLLIENPVRTPTDLEVGDVITFRAGGGLVTHRIVGVDQTPGSVAYRTQGDANNAPDGEPVLPEQVVGIYATHLPYGGYVLEAAQSRQALFLLVLVPVAALLLPPLAKLWRDSATPSAGCADPHADALHPVTAEQLPPASAREGART